MDDQAEADWLAGGDLFTPMMVDDVTMADMEATYDRLHGRIH
ncbi:MAG: hypothetical protein P8045_15955 [Candidatus Thiodiazotropha sp.]|jgi:hypothetical protein